MLGGITADKVSEDNRIHIQAVDSNKGSRGSDLKIEEENESRKLEFER
jgi:hypothetical protein